MASNKRPGVGISLQHVSGPFIWKANISPYEVNSYFCSFSKRKTNRGKSFLRYPITTNQNLLGESENDQRFTDCTGFSKSCVPLFGGLVPSIALFLRICMG